LAFAVGKGREGRRTEIRSSKMEGFDVEEKNQTKIFNRWPGGRKRRTG